MANTKFEDYGFRPSAVIEGLNRWYSAEDKHSLIRFADPDGRPDHYHFFYDHDKTIDAAIKYLRSFDIFYTPGMKWDDVKFKLNSRAWPKVNPAIDQRKARGREIRDHILKQADAEGIKIPESYRDPAASVENLMAYLFALLMQERQNKELAEEIRDRCCEENERLQNKVEMWERLYKRQKKLMEEE